MHVICIPRYAGALPKRRLNAESYLRFKTIVNILIQSHSMVRKSVINLIEWIVVFVIKSYFGAKLNNSLRVMDACQKIVLRRTKLQMIRS